MGGSQDGVFLGHQFLEQGPFVVQTVVVIVILVTAVALDTGFDITTEAGLAEASLDLSIITAEAGLAEAGSGSDSITTAEAGFAEAGSGFDIPTEAGFAETSLHLG